MKPAPVTTTEGQAAGSGTPLLRLVKTSNVVLFFSLPFRLADKGGFFFNGHIALALDGTVYHVVNPYLLKTTFLFSIMPVESWLFGTGGKWVERDAESPEYRHVYLYRTSESTRTVVFGAGLQLESTKVDELRNRFLAEDQRFSSGAVRYDFFRYNCSSIIADALIAAGLVPPSPYNAIPSRLFRRFAEQHRGAVAVEHIARFDAEKFSVRRFCIGLAGNPLRSMERWAEPFR
jgi:hypothetical protein